MPLSRYNIEQLRMLEDQLREEDPEYVQRLERFAAEIPDSAAGPWNEPAPRSTAMVFWGWVIGATLLLLLVMGLTSGAGEDGAGTDPDSGPGSSGAPSQEFSHVTRSM